MALQDQGRVKTDWDRPLEVDAFPRPISDEELVFLQRLRPEIPLPDLRKFLLQWWTRTMKLATQKYACVRQLYFLKTSVNENPKYREALARKDRGGWWIDIGSAIGQDVRCASCKGGKTTDNHLDGDEGFLLSAGCQSWKVGQPTICWLQVDLQGSSVMCLHRLT